MPSLRSPVRCKKPVLKMITGVVFAHDAHRSSPVGVPTAVHPTQDGPANPNFPSFEAVLGTDSVVHETWVTCQDTAGREHRFLIAAQYRPECEVNTALKRVLPEAEWRGGLIVMRGGMRAFVVNMGDSGFRTLAETAVFKFLFETAPFITAHVQQNAALNIPLRL
ncbi:hypothetical protein FKP32DRAFT_1579137 [Trametes sanguinea]|nr:hypothetical protein FKP32DRAFT_1579137 [Trametes sanguinea]